MIFQMDYLNYFLIDMNNDVIYFYFKKKENSLMDYEK